MAVYPPLLRKRRILAAKVETTVGTAISLSASDATYNVFDTEIQDDSDNDMRDGQSAFSSLPSVPSQKVGTVKFKTELIGGSSAPAWMSTLLSGCGVVMSTLVGSFQTNPPGSGGVKTLTLGVYEDGLFKSICGAMGNAVFTFTAGKRVMIEWTFKGCWVAPSDVALITPTYNTVAPIRFISSSLTWNSTWTPRVAEMTLDFGNDVQMREDGASAGGLLSAVIVGRKPIVKMDPEATLLASGSGIADVHGLRASRTESTLSWSCTSGATTVAFSAPKAQITKITEADRNGIQVDQVEFQLNRSAAAGDDELTITTS